MYLVDGLAVPGADVSLNVVDLVRLRVDLVPPVEAVVVEVLCHLLLVLVQGGATPCGIQTDKRHTDRQEIHRERDRETEIYSSVIWGLFSSRYRNKVAEANTKRRRESCGGIHCCPDWEPRTYSR